MRAREAIRLRAEGRKCLVVRGLRKECFPRLVTFSATGRSTAHTKCRNGVKDLKRSVKLCGWAVADNEMKRGRLIVTSSLGQEPERRKRELWNPNNSVRRSVEFLPARIRKACPDNR